MEHLKLCESEYRFMNVIWENQPLSSGQLVTLCQQELGWKKSTTYTVLKKLCDRGVAQNRDTVVTALVERDDVRTYESEKLVERAFGGSLPSFLAAFLGGKTLTEQEAAQLKQLIDEHREG